MTWRQRFKKWRYLRKHGDMVTANTPFRVGETIPLKGLWWEVKAVGPMRIELEAFHVTGKLKAAARDLQKKTAKARRG